MTVRYLAEAVDEWISAGNHYEGQRSGLARIFDEEFEGAMRKILEAPRRWPLERQHVRRYRMNRFPYKIVYQEDTDKLIVIAVAHLSRRPGYWMDRLDAE